MLRGLRVFVVEWGILAIMGTLISGSLAYDYIMDFPGRFGDHIMPKNIHILNVFFSVDRLAKSLGGTAGNIAYTMKLLGSEPLVVGALGTDGGEYLAHLRREKIPTKHIVSDAGSMTASAYLITDRDDNQVGAYFKGVKLERVPGIPRINGNAQFAIVAPSSHASIMKRHVRECAAQGIKIMFDPGQQSASFSGAEFREMIGKSDFVIGNDYEIRVVMEKTGWSARDIARNASVLITTLGRKGSQITTADGRIIQVAPCRPRKVTDPTGAGDAYRAGFLAGLERGYDIKTCAQMGSVAASYCIEHAGTQKHRFAKSGFRARYRKTYGKNVTI